MHAEILRHALDRVPLSLIVDDATVLLNLNYFFMRDRCRVAGARHRWEDVPVVHPEAFTRQFGQWCLEAGVKGKFSVVPCPAALGRIDVGLPLFSRQQQDSWLAMCRQVIAPSFDITPEMLTHTFVVDPETMTPVDEQLWEQYGWHQLPVDQEERVTRYIATACRILDNVGLTPQGVTSPGGFGSPLPFYARCAEAAVRQVTGNPTPYLFKRSSRQGSVATPVWYPDRQAGTAMGEVIACIGDHTGSWTGYGEADADRYLTADLEGGRLPAVIDAGDPAVLVSHWQGFYGLHDADRRGFRVFQTVVRRLQERDPRGERTRWRTCSQITNYACARQLARVRVDGTSIHLDLPVRVPELTLRLSGALVRGVCLEGRPLRRASTRATFDTGTFYHEDGATLVAFDPAASQVTLTVETDPGPAVPPRGGTGCPRGSGP